MARRMLFIACLRTHFCPPNACRDVIFLIQRHEVEGFCSVVRGGLFRGLYLCILPHAFRSFLLFCSFVSLTHLEISNFGHSLHREGVIHMFGLSLSKLGLLCVCG